MDELPGNALHEVEKTFGWRIIAKARFAENLIWKRASA
jgi:hypothetical protein